MVPRYIPRYPQEFWKSTKWLLKYLLDHSSMRYLWKLLIVVSLYSSSNQLHTKLIYRLTSYTWPCNPVQTGLGTDPNINTVALLILIKDITSTRPGFSLLKVPFFRSLKYLFVNKNYKLIFTSLKIFKYSVEGLKKHKNKTKNYGKSTLAENSVNQLCGNVVFNGPPLWSERGKKNFFRLPKIDLKFCLFWLTGVGNFIPHSNGLFTTKILNRIFLRNFLVFDLQIFWINLLKILRKTECFWNFFWQPLFIPI